MLDSTSSPITLTPLTADDREAFITDNQEAFNYGALVEFGERNTTFEEEGQIISRATIEESLNQGLAYRIMADGRPIGGLVVQVEGTRGNLDLFFISPTEHSQGYGQTAWALVEQTHPDVTLWETSTPYFETRNVHFYVNKLGFEITEFFNRHKPNPHFAGDTAGSQDQSQDEFFHFVKNRALDSGSDRAEKVAGSEPQRVSYADQDLLHELINLGQFKAYRYEHKAEGDDWLYLRR